MITTTAQTGNNSAFPGHLRGFESPSFRKAHLIRLAKSLGLQVSEDASRDKLVALLRANNIPESGNNINPAYWEADVVDARAEAAALIAQAKAFNAAQAVAVAAPVVQNSADEAPVKRGPGRPKAAE